MQTEGTTQNTAAILTLAGGVLAAVSGFLSWVDFTVGGQTEASKGTDLNAGLLAVVGGVVLIVMGAILLGKAGRSGGRGLAITAIVISLFVLAAGAYSALAPEDSLVQFEASDVAEESNRSETEAKLLLEQGFASGQFNAEALIGAWVAAAGGLLGLVGGVMGVATARRIRGTAAVPETAAAPPADTPPPPDTQG